VEPHGSVDHFYLASLIPLAIIGSKSFYAFLVSILGKSPSLQSLFFYLSVHLSTHHNPSPKSDVAGYWSIIFSAIVLTEHFLFRKNNFDSYRIDDWNRPSKLPIGIAALLSFFGGFAMVISSMSQVWYTGPIAKSGTGDIGVLAGSVVGATLYAILRTVERKVFLGR